MKSGVLVINAGSSSIKFGLFRLDDGRQLHRAVSGQVAGVGHDARLRATSGSGEVVIDQALPTPAAATHHEALNYLLGWLDRQLHGWDLLAAGHRVAHGGTEFGEPEFVDEAALRRLEALCDLAPLHQPHNLQAVRAIKALRPGLLQVACFDTAFHRTLPAVETTIAVPRALQHDGIRRYGFHGLAYESVMRALPAHVGARALLRVVAAHLGSGASMCAMLGGRSVATTMGFTALDGLMMGTRCGSIDPGVLLHLMRSRGLDLPRLTRLLYEESGLLGVSGSSSDMRVLLASPALAAREAVDLYCYRAARELGSLAMVLNGLDVLVFSGGVGENARFVRSQICTRAAWLGVRLDESPDVGPLGVISTPDSPVTVVVVPADEELVIANHTANLLRRGAWA